MKNKKRYVLFWIKSSRGTDSKAVFEIPKDWKKSDFTDALENWCDRFGAMHHSDNYVRYGYKPVKMLPRRELLKKYDKVCKRKAKIHEEWSILAAMLNPIKHK